MEGDFGGGGVWDGICRERKRAICLALHTICIMSIWVSILLARCTTWWIPKGFIISILVLLIIVFFLTLFIFLRLFQKGDELLRQFSHLTHFTFLAPRVIPPL